MYFIVTTWKPPHIMEMSVMDLNYKSRYNKLNNNRRGGELKVQ